MYCRNIYTYLSKLGYAQAHLAAAAATRSHVYRKPTCRIVQVNAFSTLQKQRKSVT